MVSIAIVEDNPIHMERLKTLLPSALEEKYSVSEFLSADTFLKTLQENAHIFDIVFMDIELGENSGIQAARKASALSPGIQVIFISQYLKYISPVYETQHIYFIYKPELETWLKPSLDKALSSIQELKKHVLRISWNREVFYILEEEILYMERMLRTTTIYTQNKCYNTSKKLTDLLSQIGPSFVLCQRSFIVNLEHVSAFHSSCLLLSNGKEIPVSRSHQKEVRQKLGELLDKK